MTVWVDEIRVYNINHIKPAARRWGTHWCHMTTDDPTLAELHRMAEKIGLPRRDFQHHRRWEMCHYDLSPGKRGLALRNGAVYLDSKEHARWTINRNPALKALVDKYQEQPPTQLPLFRRVSMTGDS